MAAGKNGQERNNEPEEIKSFLHVKIFGLMQVKLNGLIK